MRFAWLLALVVVAGCKLPGDPSLCAQLPDSLVDGGVDFGEVGLDGTRRIFTATSQVLTIARFTKLDPPFGGPNDFFVDHQQDFAFTFVPQDSRLQLATTTFTGGDGCAPQTVTLRGLGKGRLEVSPVQLDFGSMLLGQSATRQARVINTQRVSLSVRMVTNPPFTAIPAAFELPALGSQTVDLTAQPLLAGPNNLTMRVEARDDAGVRADGSPIFLSVTGFERELSVTPASLRLDHVPLAVTGVPPLTRQLTLTSNGGVPSPLPVASITLNDGALGARVFLDGGQALVGLSFSPVRGGPQSWSVSFDGLATAAVAVTAEAITPCALPVASNPPALDLTGQVFPARVAVTLTNPNAITCLVDAVRLEGAPWVVQLGSDQVLLDAGASLDVAIDARGPGDAGLVFTTYGAGESTVPLRLDR